VISAGKSWVRIHSADLESAKRVCDQRDGINLETIPDGTNRLVRRTFRALIKSAGDLREIAQGLDNQYTHAAKVSPAFCKIKFESVETSADRMQTIIGARPR
jgi:hypothetical protein